MMIGGSVSLADLVSRNLMTALINDLVIVPVESWTRETAFAFVQQLGRDLSFLMDDAHINLLLDLLKDSVPFHVQFFFRELSRSVNNKAHDLTEEKVRECFESNLTGKRGQPHLEHYLNRLKLALDTEHFEVATAILDTASRQGGASMKDVVSVAGFGSEIGRSVLKELISDGYIDRHDERIEFRSELLRIWWRKNQIGGAS